MLKPIMLRLTSDVYGSQWRTNDLPKGLIRRVFARLRSARHAPDGPAIIVPFN